MKSKLYIKRWLAIPFSFLFGMGVFAQTCPTGISTYLRFEETTSSTYEDQIGDHTAGSVSGSPQTTAGTANVGSALLFNGTSDALQVLNSDDYNWAAGASFSVELWVKFSDLAASNRVFIGRDANSPSAAQWWIGTDNAGKPTWFLIDANGTVGTLKGTTAINNGQWNHIVAVKDGTALSLYINGTAVSTIKSYTGNFSATRSIEIGRLTVDNTPGYYYKGGIDEVAIYDVALSSTVINEHLTNNGSYGIGYCDDATPTILSTPNNKATVGKLYTYDVNASGNPLPTYTLVASPTGMTIDAVTGEIEWTPGAAVGNTKVTVEATNSQGTESQTYQIYLAEEPDYPADLVALWKFDQNATNVEFINGHELSGSASSVVGLVDGAASFNGTSGNTYQLADTIEPAANFFDFSNPVNFSISYWMKSSASSGSINVAVGRDENDNNTHWWTGFDPATGEAVFFTRDYRATSPESQLKGGQVNDNNWHLVTASYDDNSGMTYLYVDTVLVASEAVNFANFGSDDPLNIGFLDVSPFYYFNGSLDELSFYASALDLSRIKNNYYTGKGGTSISQENYLPLFTSEFETEALEDELFRDTVYFDDLNEEDVLSASISNKPEWLNFTYSSPDEFFILSGTPTQSEVGAYEITLIVSDGTSVSETYTLTVINVNDAPEITSTPVTSVSEDEVYEYTLTLTDVDDGDVHTLTATQIPDWLDFTQTNDTVGVLSGTPVNADSDSTYAIVLTVSDGTVEVTDEFNLEVLPVNDKPVINSQTPLSKDEDTEFDITMDLIDVTDVDNSMDDLSLTVLEGTNYSFTGNTITPDANYNGSLTIDIVVADLESTSETFTFNVTVVPVNDAPVLVSDLVTVAFEKEEYKLGFVFDDPDGDAVSAETITLPDWAVYADDTLSGVPQNTDLGDHDVHIRITDGTAVENINFTITVRNVNDAPAFTSTPVVSADDYEAYEYQVVATDEDEDPITIEAVEIPLWLSFNSTENILSGTPDWEDANTTFDITLRASDGFTTTDQIFQITVTNQNDLPEITTTPIDTAQVGVNYSYLLRATDIDEDDDLVYSAVIKPDWLTFAPTSAGGSLTGKPSQNDVGNHNVILSASDGHGDDVLQEFTIQVKSTTFVFDKVVNRSLTVYPNPAKGMVTISSESFKNPERIEMLDITGKMHVMKSERAGRVMRIDISELPSGLYIVKVIDADVTHLGRLIVE